MSKELQKNVSYCNETLRLRTTLEEGFLHLGERLHKIFEERLYEGQWETFSEFLEDLRIDQGTASKLIKIYKVFILTYGIDREQLAAIGRESAYELAGIVKDKSDALSWIKKGETLKRDDIRLAVREFKTGIKQPDCEHPNAIKIRYCPDCHLKERL